MNGDMFLFDEFQSNRPRGSRRPVVTTLFDVFSNIAADEAEHVSTMQSCQDPESIVQSPNNERLVASVAASLAAVGYLTTRAGSGGELAATYGGAEAGLLELLKRENLAPTSRQTETPRRVRSCCCGLPQRCRKRGAS